MLTAQNLLNCRSLEDVATVQNQYVQQSFDRFLDGANKVAQSTASFAKEKAGPLQKQMENLMNRNRAA